MVTGTQAVLRGKGRPASEACSGRTRRQATDRRQREVESWNCSSATEVWCCLLVGAWCKFWSPG